MARLVSAGTPFLGSVKAFETVEKGWSGVNYFMGGLPVVRQTMLSFPSLFELMPRYAACCDRDQTKVSAFAPADAASWRTLRWDGST